MEAPSQSTPGSIADLDVKLLHEFGVFAEFGHRVALNSSCSMK